MALEERISRLEGVNEQILERLNSIEARLNTQMTVTVAMWVTTIAVALSTLVAVLFRT